MAITNTIMMVPAGYPTGIYVVCSCGAMTDKAKRQ